MVFHHVDFRGVCGSLIVCWLLLFVWLVFLQVCCLSTGWFVYFVFEKLHCSKELCLHELLILVFEVCCAHFLVIQGFPLC